MMTIIFLLVLMAAAFFGGWSLGFKEGNKQATDDIERLIDKAIEAETLGAANE